MVIENLEKMQVTDWAQGFKRQEILMKHTRETLKKYVLTFQNKVTRANVPLYSTWYTDNLKKMPVCI